MAEYLPDELINLCEQNEWKWLPGKTEPWCELRLVAHLSRQNLKTVQEKAKGMPRHPAFPGLVRIGDFEDVRE